MLRQFARSQPLQAIKLTAILIVLPVAAGICGIIPWGGVSSLFLVVVLGFLVGLLIIAETLVVGVRVLKSTASIRDRIDAESAYVALRTLEVASVIIPAGGFVYLISRIPEGPMAGPGAIGLLFIITGLSLMHIAGGLIRTMSEVYYFQQTN
jgi:hypothetical protein